MSGGGLYLVDIQSLTLRRQRSPVEHSIDRKAHLIIREPLLVPIRPQNSGEERQASPYGDPASPASMMNDVVTNVHQIAHQMAADAVDFEVVQFCDSGSEDVPVWSMNTDGAQHWY